MGPLPAGVTGGTTILEWLREEVQDAKEQGIVVSEDVEELSEPPSLQSKRFKSMYAYSYHFREDVTQELRPCFIDHGG